MKKLSRAKLISVVRRCVQCREYGNGFPEVRVLQTPVHIELPPRSVHHTLADARERARELKIQLALELQGVDSDTALRTAVWRAAQPGHWFRWIKPDGLKKRKKGA